MTPRTLLLGAFAGLLGTTTVFAQSPLDPAVSIPAAQRPDGLASLDWNGDGALDFVATVDNLDRVLFFQNVGGTWTSTQSFLLGAGVSAGSIVAADVDGDGDADLAVALKDMNTVQVLRNDGAGVFTSVGTNAVGLDPVHLISGDWNGDGMADLATANRDGNSLSVLVATGGGSFGAATTQAANLDPRAIAAGDWNSDGAMDLAVSCHDSREVRLFSGNGLGGFSAGTVLSVGGIVRPDGITSADVDQDGDADLLVATTGNGFNFVTTFTNTGGVFGAPLNSATGGLNPSSLAAADMNGDGFVDVAVTNQDSNALAFMSGDGSGLFAVQANHATGTRPGTVIAADLDGDGDRDVLTANRDSNDLSHFTNQSGPAGIVSYCEGGLNSAGTRATIDTTAGISISGGPVILRVLNAVPSQPGIFFYGAGRDATPFGAGTLCVAGPHYRLRPAQTLSPVGSASHVIDFNSTPAGSGAGMITAGSTWNFQFWYRDPAGTAFNLSNGLELTFQP
ncbi:MAG: VCBS repeat-containing protein [Planctomycetes bacterium]|nr:VCBS repeat-containing protein [Planctomycetota bacterium]MCB9905010.1 VCBS repeat-containing protein [Planctomycetota bacterium]